MEREQYLIDLGKTYQTDKVEHGYFSAYAKYLPNHCTSLLEIGVAKGASLQVWNDLYGTDCEIHCIDLFKDSDHVSQRWCRRREFVPHQGDQSDINFLYTIRNMFDVIIDDGSHRADHMQISFKHLFQNNLRSGGLYIIEDLGTCHEEFYRGIAQSFEDTALWLFKNYAESKVSSNMFFNETEQEIFNSLIENVTLDCNDTIVFIWKR